MIIRKLTPAPIDDKNICDDVIEDYLKAEYKVGPPVICGKKKLRLLFIGNNFVSVEWTPNYHEIALVGDYKPALNEVAMNLLEWLNGEDNPDVVAIPRKKDGRVYLYLYLEEKLYEQD